MTDGNSASTAATQAAVEARGVTKKFGATVALNDVSLRVAPGEVHALVGRNGAGKSTLVSILTGLVTPDSGSVQFAGHPAPALEDRAAWRSEVACVYQKLTTVPELSVAENLYLNRQPLTGRTISWRQLRRDARNLLAEWQLDIDVNKLARDLTVEHRQMVEIARSLSTGARFIILDEPTARLDAGGIQRLFERIKALQARGITFLYISHHLPEIFELCQRVTVYRDARHVISARIDDLSHSELVSAMTGEATSNLTDDRPVVPPSDQLRLQVQHLTMPGACTNVSLDVAPGEVVGLAGGGGSGKFAVANCIVGLQKPHAGSISINGKHQQGASVGAALAAGVGFVPEDRHHQGFIPELSIGENMTMSVPHRLGKYGFLGNRQRSVLAAEAIRRLDIVPRNEHIPAAALSGGNQQKVVMARALADEPTLLVLMSPTAGVDVKSKISLMTSTMDVARSGAGVLVVSDDLDDLRYCHRVIIMFRGEVVREVSGTWDGKDIVAAMEGVDLSHD